MATSPETAPRPLSIAAPAVAGLALGVLELIVTLAVPDEIRWDHATHTPAVLAICVAVVGLHGLAVVAASRLLERFEWAHRVFWVVLAAGFGWSWQDSVMHGDGIRSFEYFDALRVSAALLAPALLAGYVAAVGFATRLPLWTRRAAAAVMATGGAIATQVVLTDYNAFHGHLVLFAACNAVWLLTPVLRSRAIGVLGWALLFGSFLSVAALPGWTSGQRAAQRYTEIPSSLLSLPWTQAAQLPPESVLNPDVTLSSQKLAAMRRSFKLWSGELAGRPRGSNVLFIVLESTRADTWSDPEIAPRFHEWKSHGLYVPAAVAQYPATPLAYGAMFTSQPPSVLTQTPAWAETRLFDRLAGRFDHLLLTRPANKWFDGTAITDFFVPQDTEIMRHESADIGLRNLRQKLTSLPAGETFFAWAHLYEPHQPWTRRPEYDRGKGRRGAYESEVKLVDDRLGEFMEWFFAQPSAEHTLVIVIADHGEGLGERIGGKRFFGHHVHVRNIVSHVPAFFAGPGVPRGANETEVDVAQLDIMPTMFDFLGEDLPAETLPQGRSLFASLASPGPRELVTEAFSIRGKEFFKFVQAVRDSDAKAVRERFADVSSDGKYAPKIALQYGRYKLIRDMLLQETDVYDIVDDPHELKDISETKPEVRIDLERRLADWRTRQSWVVKELEAD